MNFILSLNCYTLQDWMLLCYARSKKNLQLKQENSLLKKNFDLRRISSNWSKLTSIHQQKLRFPVRTPQVESVKLSFPKQREFLNTIQKIPYDSRTMKTSWSNCWNSFQRNKAAVPYSTIAVRTHPVEVIKKSVWEQRGKLHIRTEIYFKSRKKLMEELFSYFFSGTK